MSIICECIMSGVLLSIGHRMGFDSVHVTRVAYIILIRTWHHQINHRPSDKALSRRHQCDGKYLKHNSRDTNLARPAGSFTAIQEQSGHHTTTCKPS